MSRIKAHLRMPPRTPASNWHSSLNTAVGAQQWTQPREQNDVHPAGRCAPLPRVGDLKLMKANLKFYCFQEEPKSSFFSPTFFLLRYVICYATVLCDWRYVSWMCVWFPQKPISVTSTHDSLTVTKASAELLQWHCIYSFSVLSHKGDIWKNSLSALNVQQWKWKPSFAEGHFFRKGTSKENSVIA